VKLSRSRAKEARDHRIVVEKTEAVAKFLCKGFCAPGGTEARLTRDACNCDSTSFDRILMSQEEKQVEALGRLHPENCSGVPRKKSHPRKRVDVKSLAR
jgi:hypothetical protein